MWNERTLGNCTVKFCDLRPKWFSATEAFFCQINQVEIRENPQLEQVKAIPIDKGGLRAHAQGEWYDITDSQLRIIEKLNESPGAWISGKNLRAEPTSGERPDKIIKSFLRL